MNASEIMNGNKSQKIVIFRLFAIALILSLIVILFEGGSRLVYKYRDVISFSGWMPGVFAAQAGLDDYEIAVPEVYSHWRLRAGYSSTAKDVLEEKVAAGRTKSLQGLVPTETTFEINEDGFRGKPLKQTGEHSRVLMLGDSVTFGLLSQTYPGVVEKELESRNIQAEVINAGVEGYAIRNVGLELNRYISLQPNIVSIYVGWNDIFDYRFQAQEWWNELKLIWLMRRAWRAIEVILNIPPVYLSQSDDSLTQKKWKQAQFPEIDNFEFPSIIELREIIERFQNSDATVVLITLPGLFVSEQMPSPGALAKGHLPENIKSPKALALLTESFNRSIRRLAGEKKVILIDLAKWSRSEFVPREDYFLDSVHLNSTGLRLIGQQIASALVAQKVFTLPAQKGVEY